MCGASEMLALRIDGLAIDYPGLSAPALQIPALEIAAGERIALTGPSGSGKTTFINCITGMEHVPAGRVLWNGENLSGLPEARRDRWRLRNVGLVMQDFHLFPGLSAEANVLLPQRLAHLRLHRDIRARALDLLRAVGIERPEQPVETMSRGQMQRVAVARALIAQPGVIVADEPTASLDAESGAMVADLLTALSIKSGATLIVATHDQRLIARLDRVMRLDGGQIAG